MEGNYGNIAQSLFTPVNVGQDKGELTEQQREQREIAGNMAKIQYSSIYPDLQKRYTDARTDYLKTYADLYKKNRNRQVMTGRGLSPVDQLTIEGKKQELLNTVAFGNNMNKRLTDVSNKYLDMIKETKPNELTTTSDDYKDWLKGYFSDFKKGGETEDPMASFANYVSEKNRRVPAKPEDKEKNAKEQFTELEGITNSIKTGLSEQGYSKPTSDQVENYVKNKFSPDGEVWKNYIKPRLAKAYGLDPTITDDNTIVKKLATSVLPEIRAKTYPIAPEQKQTTWYKKPDGTETASAVDKQPRDIKIGNEIKTVKGVQATYNPTTDKTTYDVQEQKILPTNPDELQELEGKAKSKPNDKVETEDANGKIVKHAITNKQYLEMYKAEKKNFKKDFVPAQYTSDDSDALGQFFEEPSKGRGTNKKVVPSKATAQPTKKDHKDNPMGD